MNEPIHRSPAGGEIYQREQPNGLSFFVAEYQGRRMTCESMHVALQHLTFMERTAS